MCATSYLQRTEDNSRESVHPFHRVGPGERTDCQAWYWLNTFTLWAISLSRAEVLIIGFPCFYTISHSFMWRYTVFIITVSHLKQMSNSLKGTATASTKGGTIPLDGFDALRPLACGGKWLAQRWGSWSLGPRRRHKSWVWQMGKVQEMCPKLLTLSLGEFGFS